MIQADFHCHTTFVDGKNTPEEMVQAALAMGITTLGFSEHAHVPFDPACSLSPEETNAYRREISRLREKYTDQICILCGIEMDVDSVDDPDAYDYVIGSVHYLQAGGTVYSVDESPAETLRCVNQGFGGDFDAYAKCYYEKLALVPARTKANIAGHFDLLTKFCEHGAAPNAQSPVYEQAALEALKSLAGSCVIEVNTGGITRGWRKTPYPSKNFLCALAEQGGRVVLSSDAHSKDTLLGCFDMAQALVAQCGFTTAGFTDRKGRAYKQF